MWELGNQESLDDASPLSISASNDFSSPLEENANIFFESEETLNDNKVVLNEYIMGNNTGKTTTVAESGSSLPAVSDKIDISIYSDQEWRGNTPRSKIMRQVRTTIF